MNRVFPTTKRSVTLALAILRQFLLISLSLMLLTPAAQGYEFHSFKLKPKFFSHTHNSAPIQIKNDLQRLSRTFNHQQAAIRVLKKQTTNATNTISKMTTPSVGSEDGNLYSRILKYLTPNYTHIGNTQTSSLLNYNRSYNLGSSNYSGFTWQKPMANFYIGVDRQVEPDLFDDTRWLIKDKFILSINAFSYLSNLKTQGEIDITEKQLAAFAGMEFIRVYRYTHFANSFNEALTKEYNKLFLSFMLFRGNGFTKMQEYEFVTKEDYLTANAGGLIHIPTIPTTPGVGVNINVGALVEYKKIAQLTMQSLGPKDGGSSDDRLRVSYEISKSKSVTTQAQLEVDFFHLLKLSLLSSELEYSFTDSDKIYLTFKDQDLNKLSGNGELATDFKSLLKLKRPQDLSTLQEFITSREHRMSENRRSRYSVLLLGGERQQETQQVVIDNAQEHKVFYRTFSKQVKYVRSFFSTILDSFFRAIFQTSLFKQFKATRVKQLNFEYEYNSLQPLGESSIVIHDEGKLSFSIMHQFTTRKTKGFWNRKYRRYAKFFTTHFTTLPASYATAIDNGQMQGPLSIKTVFRIGKDQLHYFNQIGPQRMQHLSKLICSSISRRSSKKRKCQKRINVAYQHYYQVWQPNHDMALKSLTNFMNTVNRYVDSYQDITYLFGENTFFSGVFKATTADNHSHLTYFKKGTFQGLGVIDNYRRNNITRAPASITH